MSVELFGVDRPGGRASFDLAWETWDDLRELARAFGWEPGEPGWRCERTPESLAARAAKEGAWRERLACLEGRGALDREEKLEVYQLKLCLDPYCPVDWTYGAGEMRVVAAEDAAAMAAALGRAVREMEAWEVDLPKRGAVRIGEGMTAVEHARVNGGLERGYLREVIGFLEGGGFCVAAWD